MKNKQEKNSLGLKKMKLINILVADFQKMLPEAKTAEVKKLQFRLNILEIEDLELLVSQIEVVNE